jgi:ABC-type dipeptide/oligopeptide/nickel transport system permease subunit
MNKLLRINYSLYFGIIFVTFLFFLSIFGPFLAPHTLTETLETKYENGTIFAPPLDPLVSSDYPLGTDKWGYDISSMILFGIRHTIFISLAITLIKMTIGTIIGIYVGTWKRTPGWLESIENSWSYVPLFLILYFFFNSINFGHYLETSTLIFSFIIVTSVISMPSIISSVRKKSSEISKSVFIEAARTLGASRHRIIWKHIFPQMKESLLVMFILEIVYVITIMGQLALMNIFIGGTIVRYDPTIFLSITKELSGLVGQARGNIYGTLHVLIIPLIVLLFTTLSFSLLANGLKNRYQSNYQRTPWIKTGFEPKLMPKRKEYGKRNTWWKLTDGKFIAIIFILIFIGVSSYFYSIVTADNAGKTTSKAKGVINNNSANYELVVKMNKDGEFNSKAHIDIRNLSEVSWNDLVLYFIPNVFSKGHSIETVEGYASVNIEEIKVNGKKAKYILENDTLTIQLNEKMSKRDKAKVEVSYFFTLPENGSGFLKTNEQFYLAQWYPMLATFQNGKWNKEEYSDVFKTYHTDFSNYKVEFDLPKGYSFISSADEDPSLGKKEGIVKIDRVREFYVAIVKDMEVYKTTVNDVEIRLFSKRDHDRNPDEALKLAKKALRFFQDNIGKYPHKQLDIILDKGYNNEYPGVITIDPYQNYEGPFSYSLVHEIAHQYFYGVVANDSFNETWLDEGFSEFATNVYFYLGENQGKYQSQAISYYRMTSIQNQGLGKQYSNVSIDEMKHPGYILGQSAVQLFAMVEDNYRVREKEFTTVLTEFLSDYYNHFKYKEVDTSGFLRFSKDYFQVPEGYFSEWLDTSK